ncbi:nucleotidyltransferase family protein [Actinospongicola halichondriae]|uniref:nucleotidyltransferase family protein n=1 Tax=Actinospongicola halichondriae TaxID=3236844 RepID=UPI003D440F4A
MVAAVLLAAGSGSRFEGETHKLLAPLGDGTVFSHALTAVSASGLDVYLVTGAADLADLVGPEVRVVHNAAWADGQATSVRAGIDAAGADGHDAVVVGLADQPFVTAEAWREVAASDAAIAVATYDGKRGNPVRLHASVWDLLPATGDEVGRALMRSRPDLVRPIPCAGDATDIDTLEDLHRWT